MSKINNRDLKHALEQGRAVIKIVHRTDGEQDANSRNRPASAEIGYKVITPWVDESGNPLFMDVPADRPNLIDIGTKNRVLFDDDDLSDGEIIDTELTPESFAQYVSDVLLDGAPRRDGIHDLFLAELLRKLPKLDKMLESKTQESAPSVPPGIALPDSAPEIYQGLRGPETPPEFVKRVYGPWLGKGLTRAHIRHLDPKLSVAINNWLSRPDNAWPTDVDLPTVSELNARLLAGDDAAIRQHLGRFTGREAIREATRLRSAEQRRK